MRGLKFSLILVLTLLSSNSFAQEFYPLNLISLITDENIPESSVIKINDYQLLEKGFSLENDSSYLNKKSTEMVNFSVSKKQNINEVRVDYYTIATDLTRFISRAGKSGLDKVSDNLFEKKFPNIDYRIEIKRNITFKGKKYNLLSSICRNSLAEKEIIFKNINSYPLQNSTWYFDTNLQDDKNEENVYLLSIKLSNEKKYPNKIVFLDDANFKVTLASKQSFIGTYTSGGNNLPMPAFSVSFNLFNPEPSKNDAYPPPITQMVASIYDLKKIKNTPRYFKNFFDRSYLLTIYQQELHLSYRLDEGIRNTAPPISPAPATKNK